MEAGVESLSEAWGEFLRVDNLYNWAKENLQPGFVFKRIQGKNDLGEVTVLGVYPNWIRVKNCFGIDSIQLGAILAREEELYYKNSKEEWQIIHPLYRFSRGHSLNFVKKHEQQPVDQLSLF